MKSALKNECVPYYEPGKALTVHCESAVSGKRFIMIADDKQPASGGLANDTLGGNLIIKTATAKTALVFGVSNRDGAEDEKIGSYGPGFIVPVTAGEAINAGEAVGVGAEGKAVKAVAPSEAEVKEGKIAKVPAVGLCLADCASGADAMVRVGA